MALRGARRALSGLVVVLAFTGSRASRAVVTWSQSPATHVAHAIVVLTAICCIVPRRLKGSVHLPTRRLVVASVIIARRWRAWRRPAVLAPVVTAHAQPGGWVRQRRLRRLEAGSRRERTRHSHGEAGARRGASRRDAALRSAPAAAAHAQRRGGRNCARHQMRVSKSAGHGGGLERALVVTAVVVPRWRWPAIVAAVVTADRGSKGGGGSVHTRAR